MEEYPKPITKEGTKIILNQMNDLFYKIIGKDNIFGFGFFCKMKIKDKIIPLLMTNYRLIDENYIENNFGIKIQINDELITIEFDDKRLKHINKEEDLSIIVIKENKNLKLNFLEIDELLYDKEFPLFYNKESIYIIHHYNKKHEISVSYGIIKYINNFEFLCSCNINSNRNISPIFNLSTNKLIGIYQNSSKYFVKGFFLASIINGFKKIINMHKNILNINEIDILIKIYKEDINKKIYFLNEDYTEYKDKNLIENYNHDKFNVLNTELYINNKSLKYKNYFKPDKDGEYKIKLKFFINLTDCSYMFAGCDNIIKLNFISFNTFFVKNMKYMFYGCTNLKEINLLSFDTTNVIDMSYMFYECEDLVNLDLSSFNTKKVYDMSYMFYECENLINLDLSCFNTKNVKNFEGIFYNCNKLKDLNLSSFYIKNFDKSIDMFYLRVKNIIPKINQELMLYILSKITNDENLLKINTQKKQNNFPFFPFTSKYGYFRDSIKSNFILLSNDLILILTKHIYNNKKTPYSLYFPQIKEDILFSLSNFIIENNNYKDDYSVIKVINKNFLFKNYFKIPNACLDNSDIKLREKFFINEDYKEESLGIDIPNNRKYHPGSPIYIKKANQLYLIGIINETKDLYFFNKKELFDIKKKLENIELKFKLYQIKKLDVHYMINDSNMHFILQYDLINLEYLNLENNYLTIEGMKAFQNKSLINLKYLNLSNNPIEDEGLTYLNYLSNLNELILLNMYKLSDDYFYFLQLNSFMDKINIIKCDKQKLTLKYINPNYNKFLLPNLNCLKFISSDLDAIIELNKLFSLDNICSKIIYLDLSIVDFNDEGIIILAENISKLKKIEQINVENNHLTFKK